MTEEDHLNVKSITSFNESKGKALGLEGNLGWGLVVGLMLFITCISVGSLFDSLLISFVIGILLLLVSVLVLFLFFVGKPPGYATEFLEMLFKGPDDDIHRYKYKKNPFIK
ncbi:MAG TPA: hypothetical protein QF753_07180 [Victivallales bacterium]|nr:hypothetical protein [Victivallales bacterium]